MKEYKSMHLEDIIENLDSTLGKRSRLYDTTMIIDSYDMFENGHGVVLRISDIDWYKNHENHTMLGNNDGVPHFWELEGGISIMVVSIGQLMNLELIKAKLRVI